MAMNEQPNINEIVNKQHSKIFDRIRQFENNFQENTNTITQIKNVQLQYANQKDEDKSTCDIPEHSINFYSNDLTAQDDRLIKFKETNINENNSGIHTGTHLAEQMLTVSESQKILNRKLSLLNIWDIDENLSIIGQCWSNRTEVFNKRNNIDEMNRYLESNYQNQYVVYSFTKNGISNNFKRSQIFDDVDFNLDLCLEIARSCKCWLTFNKKIKIIIEMKQNKESIILFIVCAILSFNKIYKTSEIAYNNLINSNPLQFTFVYEETLLRYIRYFDKAIIYNENKKVPQLQLHQIIITTIPSIVCLDTYKPVLHITQNGTFVARFEENCYKDDTFIIFSEINQIINNNIKLTLFFEYNNKQYHILDLTFNTLFYQQGLYRFSRSEIETQLPNETIYKFFTEDFCLDLVFIENREILQKSHFTDDQDIIQDIKHISDHMFNGFSDVYFQKLLDCSYNRIIAKFCAQMEYSMEESTIFVKLLEERGYKNLIYHANPVNIPEIKEFIDQTNKRSIELEKPFEEKSNFKELYNNLDFEIENLDQITDTITQNVSYKGKGRFRSFLKKPAEIKHEGNLVVRKQLHWTCLNETEATIFSEMDDINIFIDFKRFEELFCESLNTEAMKIENIKEKCSILNDKRIFLVSLSLKHLEINKISGKTFESIIEQTPELLSIQDLLNLERSFPTEDELEILKNNPVEMLNSTEKAMLEFSRNPEIPKIVQILIFERKFFDEIPIQKQVLENLFTALNQILNSRNLKIILKLVLDIGNIVNFTYSIKKRKAAGFKIESLSEFTSYFGSNNKGLCTFLIELLNKYPDGVYNIFTELELIHNVKNEDLSKIKDKINQFIRIYLEKVTIYRALAKERPDCKRFFGYACKTLIEVGKKYKDCMALADTIKQKFGEESSKKINCILIALSDFLEKLQHHKNNCNQK